MMLRQEGYKFKASWALFWVRGYSEQFSETYVKIKIKKGANSVLECLVNMWKVLDFTPIQKEDLRLGGNMLVGA